MQCSAAADCELNQILIDGWATACAWPWILGFCEVNTLPGFTRISMYPKLWDATGITYRSLISQLIELALERHQEKARTVYSRE